MDVPTTLTITQAILDWTLLGFLLAWMVTFAVLALRATPMNTMKSERGPQETYAFLWPSFLLSIKFVHFHRDVPGGTVHYH